jgi:hypothetical protein
VTPNNIVFLFDVDNTLLDNDGVTDDLREHLEREVGHKGQQRYWVIFEQLRAELGYVDYLGALQRYRIEYPRDPHLLTVSSFLVNYPFADRLFPYALKVLTHVKQWGQPVILSDGDVVFQPRKIEQSGLFQAVDGHVLIYIHKERELDDIERRYPRRSLRADRRQASDFDRGEESLGGPCDHGVSTPRALCQRPGSSGRLSTPGCQHRSNRRLTPL